MYLLDSDVFITAKNTHYAFDIAPGFWQWIERAHGQGRVYTVHRCYEEVVDGGDELSEWMKRQPGSFALKVTSADQTSLRHLAEWAMGLDRRAGVAASWLDVGDYFLVAQALTLGFTVVTHEQPRPEAKSAIKIPDACNAMGVPYMGPFDMLRQEGAQLGLA